MIFPKMYKKMSEMTISCTSDIFLTVNETLLNYQ
nr:MAG TPA: hypothetical protein [Caudoviricetes sp.]DAW80396.1 MAG TPA: hypothetical protein [Caudoviricetes sp.]